MLTIVDRPLIQYVVDEAREAGIEDFIFVTGRHKEMLEEHFDYQPELMETLEARGKKDLLKKLEGTDIAEGKLFLTRQHKPLGLGHAVWCARHLVGDEPFAVMLVVAVVISHLTQRIRDQADSARDRERRTASLYALSREVGATQAVGALLEAAARLSGNALTDPARRWAVRFAAVHR